MPAPTQTRHIRVSVDAGNSQAALDAIARSLGGVNRNTKSMADGFGAASSALTGFFGAIGVRELASFSDQLQNLNNRLLAMGGNQQQVTSTMQELVGVARSTNQSLESTSDSYFRMSVALKDVGISQGTLIDLTKTIANTFRLSGASTEEATNATIQLGQAFSLGVLRGQDLRSVMSQNVTLTRLLRKEFGNNLLKAAEQGLITVPRLMEILYKNMDKVNNQAALMSATFEQSAVKALDAFKLKVFEVSQTLDASGKFANGMKLATDNMGAIGTAGALLGYVGLAGFAAGIARVASALGLLNPAMLAGAAGIAVMIAAFGKSWDIADLTKQMEIGFVRLKVIILNFAADVVEKLEPISFLFGPFVGNLKKAALELRLSAEAGRQYANALQTVTEDQDATNKKLKEGSGHANKWAEDIAKAKKALTIPRTAKELLSDLNKEFSQGRITVEQYNAKIVSTEKAMALIKFNEGEKDLVQLNDAYKKLEIFGVNQEFRKGKLTFDEYRVAIAAINLRDLTNDLNAGKISLADYNEKLAEASGQFSTSEAFTTGLQKYINSVGNTTSQVADAVTHAFKGLEDTFVEAAKTGTLSFNKMAESILEDLARIIIRASIIQPLAQGILKYSSSPSTDTINEGGFGREGVTQNAHGNVFDMGIKRFAGGGVVSSPTMFGYGKGQRGLMGEAGPEAIIPLTRGSGGDLGVKATVTPVNINIINQAGASVTQKETTGPSGEKTIEIMIANKVREGLASGTYDKVFHQSYGLRRKGS